MQLWLVILLSIVVASDRAGTPEDRAQLFDNVVGKTLQREAFSPLKNAALGIDFEAQARALRPMFLAADSDAKLLHALVRLSALRRDGHLTIRPEPDGLPFGTVSGAAFLTAPVRFAVDYATPGQTFLFISDLSKDVQSRIHLNEPSQRQPGLGDRLVAVNGREVLSYLEMARRYLAYSTVNRMWLEFAVSLPVRRVDFGPELYEENITFTLETPRGRRYTMTCEYTSTHGIEWQAGSVSEPFLAPPHLVPQAFTRWAALVQKKYPGFHAILRATSFTCYLARQGEVLLLDWHGFLRTSREDIDLLMAFASQNQLLDHDVICDLSSSRGGQASWYLLQRLVSDPFKVTMGNIRICDITEQFIKAKSGATRSRRLRQWLQSAARDALGEGRLYTEPVPFKLRALPANSDGVLRPASTHFRGRLVCLFGPLGRSQIDQFATMVVDNQLGHSIGMPTGGSSNTWEWSETLRLPNSPVPLVKFMWSIGHTIRPNGEILEGNPASPAEYVPVTRTNFPHYHGELIRRALRYLER